MRGTEMMDKEISTMRYTEVEEETETVDFDFDNHIATISCSDLVQVWRIDAEGELLEQIF